MFRSRVLYWNCFPPPPVFSRSGSHRYDALPLNNAVYTIRVSHCSPPPSCNMQPTVRIAKLIQSKIPEIEKSLKLVTFLKAKESASETTLTTRYNLADMLYSKASIDCASGIVNLWLGANVMLEYTYDEAIDLLSTKLTKANKDLEDTTEDLALIRNQIITSEVNISRIYNWDVKKKREDRK
eukprot:scaffold2927_cov268-Chaetoceros_neogracile.AAC.26